MDAKSGFPAWAGVLAASFVVYLVAPDFVATAPKLVRNVLIAGPVPEDLKPLYGNCKDKEYLTNEVTVVVSVKDSCSQGPTFLEGLHAITPKSMQIIYTYPNFSSCSEIDFTDAFSYWTTKPITIALPIHASPMQGWLDAVPYVKTPYTYLVHNDGYALDHTFLCELTGGLKKRRESGDLNYTIAAPMLYESKYDGSLAAHATQANLRVSMEGGKPFVRHDHSLKMALRRQGEDLYEQDQIDFVEDHGFLIVTETIPEVIDPKASMTMEYIDMIMTIRSNFWKVLMVPTARLEFRITQFSWRDIPYFMYKRSEITAQSCRDYLSTKWNAQFPNTGFWTFIKYTIIEQHTYDFASQVQLAWEHQALLAFGFFQMVGWNSYVIEDNGTPKGFLDVLETIEQQTPWQPPLTINATRQTERRVWGKQDLKPIKTNITDLIPVVSPSGISEMVPSWLKPEADLKLEYFPFSVAEYKIKGRTCDILRSGSMLNYCGLVVQHKNNGCSCWINLPTFKAGGFFPKVIDVVAASIKIPSRISTFWEMRNMNPDIKKHTAPLTRFIDDNADYSFNIYQCSHTDPSCDFSFVFGRSSTVQQFKGTLYSPVEIATALDRHLVTLPK